MKKYKFITIKQVNSELWKEKPVYRIFNNSTNAELGFICYWPQWKRFIFSAREGMVFDYTCLLNVMDFLQNRAK